MNHIRFVNKYLLTLKIFMNIAKQKEKCTKLSMSVSMYQLVKAAIINSPIKQQAFIFHNSGGWTVQHQCAGRSHI